MSTESKTQLLEISGMEARQKETVEVKPTEAFSEFGQNHRIEDADLILGVQNGDRSHTSGIYHVDF